MFDSEREKKEGIEVGQDHLGYEILFSIIIKLSQTKIDKTTLKEKGKDSIIHLFLLCLAEIFSVIDLKSIEISVERKEEEKKEIY